MIRDHPNGELKNPWAQLTRVLELIRNVLTVKYLISSGSFQVKSAVTMISERVLCVG